MLKNNFFCWFFSPPTSLISRHPLVVGQNKFLLHFYKVPYKKKFQVTTVFKIIGCQETDKFEKKLFSFAFLCRESSNHGCDTKSSISLMCLGMMNNNNLR